MTDKLILTVVVEGENIMSNPLLKAHGYAKIKKVVEGENIMSNPLLKAHGYAKINGKGREINFETPITSIKDFVQAFEELFVK